MVQFTVLLLLALKAFVAGSSLHIPLVDQILAKNDVPRFVNELPQTVDYEDPKNQPEMRDTPPNRIVGGSEVTISEYPFAAATLYNQRGSTIFLQWCGGSILTTRTILSVAHCYMDNRIVHNTAWWRIRVGSTFASSGGTLLEVDRIVVHDGFVSRDNDIAILRIATDIVYIPKAVAPAKIAGASYYLADNEAVWAIGWGATSLNGEVSEHLRHVEVLTINQERCRERYGVALSDNMLCSGWLDVGGRDQCQGDSGSPVLHNDVVVGICAWGTGCALAQYPGVNTRISSFTEWITTTVIRNHVS